ncbi:alpha/beta fold hydrolase [Amycolatopsis anabasis]|uniref:alpha/beta fold hydrolase n=1 Tax=Amycolatopsis anabasis TaxID=1840409 RepID=UPI00131E5B25|nr:alpha/beta hydrolase [Amycolatopsis anabasis]
MAPLSSVESRDGTVISFEVLGQGPPMVLVHGSAADRSRWTPVVAALAERFTVHVVDRRGRGLSIAERGPYDLRREGEDIAAVAESAGPDVYVVGHSYGALCSLEAALVTDAIDRMFLYEPPAPVGGRAIVPPETIERVRAAAASGDPVAILETFFREVIHVSTMDIQAMKGTPIWSARLAAAPTIVRELDGVENFAISDRLEKITIPVRLLLGTEGPAYFRPAAEAIAARLPHADLIPLHGQDHLGIDGDPEQFVEAVLAFAGR